MKRTLKALTLVVAVGVLLYIAYFITKNTSLVKKTYNAEKIVNNNNTSITDKDLVISELIRKPLIIPKQFEKTLKDVNPILNLPRDLEISVFAAGLNSPRGIAFDPYGNIYVAEKGSGEISLVKDTDNNNVADSTIVIDTNLTNVHGVEYYKGDLYVAEENQVSVYRGIGNDGKYLAREVLVSNLPTDGGHNTRTVRIGPDEKLYVSIGSSCNVCEEKDKRRASIVRYNLDGTNEELFATGLRNTVDFIFDKQQRIWGVDNGRDLIGDNIPPEEVNLIRVGNNYGWPYCYGKGIANPEFESRGEYCLNNTIYPKFELPAHTAPLGLDFATWEKLESNLFIALHGSWNSTTPVGYKIVRIDTSSELNKPINFITGWLEDNGTVWGRPVDIKFYKQDKMLITDDKLGVIYIVYPKQ